MTVVPQPGERDAGVIGFTAHAVVFTDEDPEWVAAQLPPGDLSAPLSPLFLVALSDRSDRTVDSPQTMGFDICALVTSGVACHPAERCAGRMRWLPSLHDYGLSG